MYVTGGDNVYIIDVNTNTETSDSPINIPDALLYGIAYDSHFTILNILRRKVSYSYYARYQLSLDPYLLMEMQLKQGTQQ